MSAALNVMGKMARRWAILAGAMILLALPGMANAQWGVTNVTISSLGNQTFSNGNADQNNAGTAIGTWATQAAGTVWSGGLGCVNPGYTWTMASQSPISGVTYTDRSSGLQYPVYPTGVPNIGLVVGVADGNSTSYQPVTTTWTQIWTGFACYTLGANTQAMLVATGPLHAGTYSIPAQTVASLKATTDAAGTAEIGPQATLQISGATVTVTAQSCAVTAGQNQIVTLPTVSVGNFQGVGSSPPTSSSFNIQLSCPAGIALFATMTDATNPANTGNALTLVQNTTSATGVGVQVHANGSSTPVSFGPDSSLAGNTNQWYVGGNAATPATIYNIPFVASYVQGAAKVGAGSIDALATITFSYQ